MSGIYRLGASVGVAACTLLTGCIRREPINGGTQFTIGVPKIVILLALVAAIVVIVKRRG